MGGGTPDARAAVAEVAAFLKPGAAEVAGVLGSALFLVIASVGGVATADADGLAAIEGAGPETSFTVGVSGGLGGPTDATGSKTAGVILGPPTACGAAGCGATA